MKKICVLFLLIGNIAMAQQITVKGFLKDTATNEAVASASIGVKNSALGTISNEEGIFQLTLPKTAEVVIYSLGYKPVTLSAASFDSEIKTIVLEQNEELLEEVIVSKIPIEKLLETLITSSIARFNKPIILDTYYREFVKVNDKYTKFSDGLLEYHINGSTKKNKSELIISQSRAAQLFTDEEAEKELIDFDTFVNVQKGITYNYDFTFLKQLLLDDDKFERYDLELKSIKDKSGKELYAITFEPKTGGNAIYKGSITYDADAKLILEIDVDVNPGPKNYRERNFLIARVTFMNNSIKAGYKLVGNNYILSYSNRYSKLRITMQKKKIDKTIESKSDIIVTNLRVDDLSYDKKRVYKEKDLYKNGNNYSDKFWLKNNSMVLTADEQQIINKLEKETVKTP